MQRDLSQIFTRRRFLYAQWGKCYRHIRIMNHNSHLLLIFLSKLLLRMIYVVLSKVALKRPYMILWVVIRILGSTYCLSIHLAGTYKVKCIHIARNFQLLWLSPSHAVHNVGRDWAIVKIIARCFFVTSMRVTLLTVAKYWPVTCDECGSNSRQSIHIITTL